MSRDLETRYRWTVECRARCNPDDGKSPRKNNGPVRTMFYVPSAECVRSLDTCTFACSPPKPGRSLTHAFTYCPYSLGTCIPTNLPTYPTHREPVRKRPGPDFCEPVVHGPPFHTRRIPRGLLSRTYVLGVRCPSPHPPTRPNISYAVTFRNAPNIFEKSGRHCDRISAETYPTAVARDKRAEMLGHE